MQFDTKLTFNKLASHVKIATTTKTTTTTTTFKTSAYKKHAQLTVGNIDNNIRQQVRQCDAANTKMVNTFG